MGFLSKIADGNNKEVMRLGKLADKVLKLEEDMSILTDEEIKELLYKQVKSSVRWSESIDKMLDMGVDTFIELGPGKVLSGFIKEISREKGLKVNIFNVEDIKSLNKTLEGIGVLND